MTDRREKKNGGRRWKIKKDFSLVDKLDEKEGNTES